MSRGYARVKHKRLINKRVETEKAAGEKVKARQKGSKYLIPLICSMNIIGSLILVMLKFYVNALADKALNIFN